MKRANKKCTKGKEKMWRKGQSCSFNPKLNKHRQAAKKRAVFGNQGEGVLTESMLAQHNKITTGSEYDPKEDEMSVGGGTALTAFTNCSLPTFTRLLKNWNANSFLHKEMVAVLAAVTEILQTNGGKETETEYFAALMTTLNVVDTDEGVTAVVCLLAMLVKRLNESVLKSQCKTSCEIFIKLLIKYMNSDHCALLRNLLKIMYTFLKVKTQWTESSDDLNVILEFTTHHKPRVRRMAHQVIKTLLTDHIPESATTHPCSTAVSEFCVKRLENSAGLSEVSREIFYILALLQEVIGVFPKLSIKKCCETIFRVMTLSNAVMTLSGLKALQGLFIANKKCENLPVELNARIITALYDYQPNVKDSDCLVSWLQLMERALTHLFSLDEKLCISHLPKFYSVAVKCWLNESDSVMMTVSSTLKHVLHGCINPSSEVFQQMLFEDPINNAVHKMFHSVEDCLGYQYHQAWSHVLYVLAGFFETVGKHCYTVMMKCLHSLAELHDSYNFPHISELERTIGSAIQHIGPRIVLKAIPLHLESEKPNFQRSWLLPLLRDNVKKTELEFFIKFFLPLASKLKNKALILLQEGKKIENKLYEVLCSQIWSLLPGFCTEPTDLNKCFQEVARTLGMILRDDASLRMPVLSSLRLLIYKNLENEENRNEIAKYAKNYIPILFNLYTTETKNKEEEKVRLAVYETLKLYLTITDKELCATFFGKAKEKLVAPEIEIFMQHSLIDLCRAMLPCLNGDHIKELYEYAKPLLKHPNNTVQKKAYSVIKDICSSELDSCKSFVKENLDDLRSLLAGNKMGLTPATRSLRLNCLQSIVSHLTENEKSAIAEIVPEAVLSTKENSMRARTAAYNLLVEIGHTLKGFMPDDPKGGLREYMKMLLAGLIGTPHLMSATILAIGRVVYEFKDELDSDLIHLLIENICLLMSSKSREVVVASISFLKVLFVAVDTLILAQHVEYLVKSVTDIYEDNQRHFRFKAKEIFTRLIRKFGYEMISKLLPETYKKQLTSIRKIEAKKKRKQNLKDDDDADSEIFASNRKTNEFEDVLADTDDEMDVDDKPKEKMPKSRIKINAPCIEEQGDDDIVDFLDPAVNKRLLTVKHQNSEPKKQTDSFPVSEDGRLIIQEDEKKVKIQKEIDEKNAILKELGASQKKNKRKREDIDSEDDADNRGNKDPKSKGIHRALVPKIKRRCPGEEYKAKKAGGDVKKGKYDPFAYLPLNRQALNKRKQVKLKGQFNNIVRAAKKGAAVGLKRKSRDAKKKKRRN